MYHFSPKTNRAEKCNAASPDSCRYRGADNAHFDTPEGVYQHIQEKIERDQVAQGNPEVATISKKPRTSPESTVDKVKSVSADREATMRELSAAENDVRTLEKKVAEAPLAQRTTMEYQLDTKYANIDRLSQRIKSYDREIAALKDAAPQNGAQSRTAPSEPQDQSQKKVSRPGPQSRKLSLRDQRRQNASWRKRSLSTWVADDLTLSANNAPTDNARHTIEDIQQYCRDELTYRELPKNPTLVADRHRLMILKRLRDHHGYPIQEPSPEVTHIDSTGSVKNTIIHVDKPDTSHMNAEQTYVVNAVHESTVKIHNSTIQSPDFFNVPKK